MLTKKDKIISMTLYNPHEHDFLYKRPDGTTFVVEHRKDKEDFIYQPTSQLELPL